MMHIAIHDAINGIDRRSRTYALDIPPLATASVDAAVAAAAHDVLKKVLEQIPLPFPQACIDAGVASVEADYTDALAAVRTAFLKLRASRSERPLPRPSWR